MSTPKPSQPVSMDVVMQSLETMYKQQLRMRQRVYALEAEAKVTREGRRSRMPIEFRSQHGEDLFLWDILGGQTTGFFIEVGAFDGYDYAVTYALEAAGWNGLLIEAIPEKFEACQKRRPHSRVVNAAVSKRGSTGTTSFSVADDAFGGMLSYLDPEGAAAKGVSSRGIPVRQITVPLTTIGDLLQGHEGPIDVAVIDVEGSEIEALDGFDLVKWRPRVILLEDNSLGQDPALAAYMAKFPYVHIGWVDCNRVYARHDCDDIRERLAALTLYA